MDFYDFPYIGNNNPNCRTHIFQRGWNHQPNICAYVYIYIHTVHVWYAKYLWYLYIYIYLIYLSIFEKSTGLWSEMWIGRNLSRILLVSCSCLKFKWSYPNPRLEIGIRPQVAHVEHYDKPWWPCMGCRGLPYFQVNRHVYRNTGRLPAILLVESNNIIWRTAGRKKKIHWPSQILAATHGLPNYKAKQHQDRPRPIEGMYKPMRTQQLNLGIPAGLGWSNNEECVPQSLVLRNTIDHSKPVYV